MRPLPNCPPGNPMNTRIKGRHNPRRLEPREHPPAFFPISPFRTDRWVGAIALGIVNALLAFLPLVETGPGMDSDCGRHVRETQEPPRKSLLPGARAFASGSS